MRKPFSTVLSMIVGGVIVGAVFLAVTAYAQYGNLDALDDVADVAPAATDGPTIVNSSFSIDNVFQYQGQLLQSNGTPVNGVVSISFRLYDSPSSPSALWFEDASVTVTNGWFTEALGDIPGRGIPDTLLDGRNLWLGVQVGGDAEMTPRQPIRPAMFAVNARLLDGKPSSDYLEARRGPIAYGVVKAGGGRESGWHFTSSWNNNRYEISLEIDGVPLNYDANQFTTIVTPMAGNDICNGSPSIAMTNSAGGRLVVFIQGLDGGFKQCPFHFMTIQHKP